MNNINNFIKNLSLNIQKKNDDNKFLFFLDTLKKIIFELKENKNILLIWDYDADWIFSSSSLFSIIEYLKNKIWSKSKIHIKISDSRAVWYWNFKYEELEQYNTIIFLDFWWTVKYKIDYLLNKNFIIIDHHNSFNSFVENVEIDSIIEKDNLKKYKEFLKNIWEDNGWKQRNLFNNIIKNINELCYKNYDNIEDSIPGIINICINQNSEDKKVIDLIITNKIKQIIDEKYEITQELLSEIKIIISYIYIFMERIKNNKFIYLNYFIFAKENKTSYFKNIIWFDNKKIKYINSWNEKDSHITTWWIISLFSNFLNVYHFTIEDILINIKDSDKINSIIEKLEEKIYSWVFDDSKIEAIYWTEWSIFNKIISLFWYFTYISDVFFWNEKYIYNKYFVDSYFLEWILFYRIIIINFLLLFKWKISIYNIESNLNKILKEKNINTSIEKDIKNILNKIKKIKWKIYINKILENNWLLEIIIKKWKKKVKFFINKSIYNNLWEELNKIYEYWEHFKEYWNAIWEYIINNIFNEQDINRLKLINEKFWNIDNIKILKWNNKTIDNKDKNNEDKNNKDKNDNKRKIYIGNDKEIYWIIEEYKKIIEDTSKNIKFDYSIKNKEKWFSKIEELILWWLVFWIETEHVRKIVKWETLEKENIKNKIIEVNKKENIAEFKIENLVKYIKEIEWLWTTVKVYFLNMLMFVLWIINKEDNLNKEIWFSLIPSINATWRISVWSNFLYSIFLKNFINIVSINQERKELQNSYLVNNKEEIIDKIKINKIYTYNQWWIKLNILIKEEKNYDWEKIKIWTFFYDIEKKEFKKALIKENSKFFEELKKIIDNWWEIWENVLNRNAKNIQWVLWILASRFLSDFNVDISLCWYKDEKDWKINIHWSWRSKIKLVLDWFNKNNEKFTFKWHWSAFWFNIAVENLKELEEIPLKFTEDSIVRWEDDENKIILSLESIIDYYFNSEDKQKALNNIWKKIILVNLNTIYNNKITVDYNKQIIEKLEWDYLKYVNKGITKKWYIKYNINWMDIFFLRKFNKIIWTQEIDKLSFKLKFKNYKIEDKYKTKYKEILEINDFWVSCDIISPFNSLAELKANMFNKLIKKESIQAKLMFFKELIKDIEEWNININLFLMEL